ncbi:hypothetical protein [Streptomyces pratensis]|uniref:hypothetical protein n=1 Tax=Streptomyces pratensis TaxID=1169025 RepID=UPI001EE41CB4|nr:hypothetical protein [Streptomyces pratensis]
MTRPLRRAGYFRAGGSHGPVFIDSEAQLGQYRLLLKRLDAAALPTQPSRDLIHSVAQEL